MVRALGDAATRNPARSVKKVPRQAPFPTRPCDAALHARPNAPERTAMPYSLQQAATATGLNKSTILRAIKAGKVSAVRDEQGQWQVEPAELHRVYPPVADAAERTGATPRDAARDAAGALAMAHQRAALAEE